VPSSAPSNQMQSLGMASSPFPDEPETPIDSSPSRTETGVEAKRYRRPQLLGARA
jgi:hypothetical protein